MMRLLKIKTPGRLHFGLSSFGNLGSSRESNSLGNSKRQFSGLGMMVDSDEVGIELEISPAATFQATGPLAKRVEQFAQAFAKYQRLSALPACQIKITNTPGEHTGLGVGTQLGLAVAAGLSEWLDISWRDATLLSQMTGRGRRSAIGTHGFLHGGLLVDNGKLPEESIGQLAARVEVPTNWRFVLIREPTQHGLAGPAEAQAINELPPVPAAITQQLHDFVDTQILPAARDADWRKFSEALYQYGHTAGERFASAQGGPFASPEIAALVDAVRGNGFPGAGQSSWGPTVFAVTENEAAAQTLVEQLQATSTHQHCHFTITQANNTGASIHSK